MESSQSELDYYMNKEVKILAKKPAGRNYRPRRKSSDSHSSDEKDDRQKRLSADNDSKRHRTDSDRHRRNKDSENRGRHAILRSDRVETNRSRSRNDREHSRNPRSRSPVGHRDRRREMRPKREDFNVRCDKIIGRNELFINSEHDSSRHRESSYSSESNRGERHVYREERFRNDDHVDQDRRSEYSKREEYKDRRDIMINQIVDVDDMEKEERLKLEREELYRKEIERLELERRNCLDEMEARRHSVERFDELHTEQVISRSERSYVSKRGLSPVSMERSEYSSKYRRDLSPVSDTSPHGELKIHVSARGRWIESDDRERDLSPVSDVEIEHHQAGPSRRVINDHIIVRNEEDDSMNNVELVSDEESISDVSFDNLQNWDRERYDLEMGRQEREERHNRDFGHYVGRDIGSRRYDTDREERQVVEKSRSPEYRSRKAASEGRSSEAYSGKHGSDLKIKLPNICRFYNGKGCMKTKCTSLHVCRPFILENCKFGSKCRLSHSFFTGDAFGVLKRFNPDIVIATGMHQKIVNMLQRRILISCGRDDLLHVIDKKDEELEDRLEKQGHLQTQMNDIHDRRSEISNHSDSHSRQGSANVRVDQYVSPTTLRNDGKDFERERRGAFDSKSKSRNTERDLSPVSVEEENWDNHERYEKVSDDGNEIAVSLNKAKAKKPSKQELETVSSSESEDGLDKPVAYPAPTPENIAVAIGMNDPLVFNRPLGSNPTSYVGPMNRPPPSVPLYNSPLIQGQPPPKQNNPPLFGQVPQRQNHQNMYGQPSQQLPYRQLPPNQVGQPPFDHHQPPPNQNNQPLFGQCPPTQNNPAMFGQGLPQGMGQQVPMMVPRPGMSATGPYMNNMRMPQGQIPVPPGQLPNHLPSAEFMKQVIQNFPPLQMQNTFKNDNTPAIVQIKEQAKKKSKSDIDPELKEPIKILWKFPHKSVVNMTIIEFVTETEAYKEEFIAEIVRILVTLDLPYVTMRKLTSLIKEKVMINIASVTNMKKILEMYPSNFKIIETVDSDDDDDGARKSVQIKANITLGFCEKHGFLPFAIGKCECNALHMCKFYMLNDCPNKHCKFGHKLKTDHNLAVLKNHKLHRLTGEELFDFMSDVDNRNKETIPSLCKYYTREKGCYKGDSTDHDSICHGLHMCYYALKGKCTNKDCERAHSIRDLQPHSLLVKFGLDPNELGDEKVMQMLCENMVEMDKSKSLKNQPHKSATSTTTVPQKAGGILIDEKCKPSQTVSGSKLVKRESKVEPILNQTLAGSASSTKVPAICKFYQNEMGCRKKDWGPDGKCHFLHICQYFVTGECKFGDKCKRSHDFFSGPAATLLCEYNIHPEGLTVDEILGLLNNTMSLVEQPLEAVVKREASESQTVVKKEVQHNAGASVKVSGHSDTKVSEKLATGILKSARAAPQSVASQVQGSGVSTAASMSYQSCNIEDVIKHIMEERRVNK